jgi:hypothetical protein
MAAFRSLCILALFLLGSAVLAPARVVRVEIAGTSPVLGGKRFGLAGAYETVTGKLHFAVNPALPANQPVTDLPLAPRNAAGEVEFSADFHLIRPVDASKGNGAVLLEISNRGGKGLLPFFHGAQASSDPRTAAHFGDAFLLNQGYTLLWVGWQFDVPQEPGRLRSYLPVAKNPDGSPITGLVRANIIVTDTVFSHSLADRGHIPYPAAAPDDPRNQLTVRDLPNGPARVLPRSDWQFARWENGQAIPDPGSVLLRGGLQPNKIYDLVYLSQDPVVAGLGMAAIRDAISFLKHGSPGVAPLSSPSLERAYGFGISQSGRFLRAFLYDGFNEDESGRRVFDGLLSHVAGGGLGSFNVRFAQPSRDGHPFLNFHYPTDIFPFSNSIQRDPETGLEDGILARYRGKEALLPKIFYTNSSYEYWGRAASQIHTTLDGARDLDPGDNTRIYQFAGTQHGAGPWPPEHGIGQQWANPHSIRPGMRALLVAMDEWVRDGIAPPPSRHPLLANATLVRPEDLRFPAIRGIALAAVKQSAALQQAWRADYGPRFRRERIVDQEPPALGKAFPLFVPQVDEDGNEITGIRLPDVAVPLATYTGWNLFNEKSGPPGILSNMVGSFIPFPRTRAEAQRNADPRRPLDERYRSREEYLGKVAASCAQLVRERLMLPADALGVLEGAGARWDWIHQNPSSTSPPPAP